MLSRLFKESLNYHICYVLRHIEEDSQVLTQEMLAKMSPEELEFHYFSAHDFDRNSKLDGLEILKVCLIFVLTT